jgi:hypothetical protein
MRRRTVHALFGAACLVVAAVVALQALRLAQARRVERALAHAAEPAAPDRDLPEARLAQALALGATGHYEAALAAFKTLARDEHGALQEASTTSATCTCAKP